MEGALVLSTKDLRLGRPRIGHRLVIQDRDEGVELAVGSLDTLQKGLGQLHRRQFLATQQAGGLVDIQEA